MSNMNSSSKLATYRGALHELMLLSGYVPNREEMEAVPPDVEAFVEWFREADHVMSLDRARDERDTWKTSYENLAAATALPGHGEDLTLEQYAQALRIGRTVRVERPNCELGCVFVRQRVGPNGPYISTQDERERYRTGIDEHEIRLGPWFHGTKALPLGSRYCTVDHHDDLSFAEAMEILEKKSALFAEGGSQARYPHPVAFREYRRCRSYLIIGAEGYPVIYAFSLQRDSGPRPLGWRPVSFEDMRTRWLSLDPESALARPISEAAMAEQLTRSQVAYYGEP